MLPKLIPGAGTTLGLTVCGVGIGIIIGLLMSLMKMSNNRVLKVIANVYIEAFRGTPLYVQIFLFHYGVASVVGTLFFDGKIQLPDPRHRCCRALDEQRRVCGRNFPRRHPGRG